MNAIPTEEVSVREVFGIDTEMKVKGFADRSDEDRLQEVVWAWDQIKDSRNFVD